MDGPQLTTGRYAWDAPTEATIVRLHGRKTSDPDVGDLDYGVKARSHGVLGVDSWLSAHSPQDLLGTAECLHLWSG
ncbi:hypothetical protein BAUCODRAFT_37153 [Baudoinia panamericana UAMH 10762]|uniref:Uncharacterized protein n=1 Tax=Baudoinia panamericana (strain UAMH 10762) TaxID=717646 RepID=M2N3B4_BAUPA|nr:uncharacterized protein BAUCODRAFT_37153 [Baudoinia panamericana UAMH 10762]EMC93469.1 hypothetical protein BAUCODRAFT_37153 [Baudoinia panamericana UAMH 10762]